MNNNIDNLLDQFDGLEEVNPSEEFLEKLEDLICANLWGF